MPPAQASIAPATLGVKPAELEMEVDALPELDAWPSNELDA
jgi:hypothetical protein